LIRIRDRAEGRGVPSLQVIGMETLGLHAVNAMDGLLIGVGTNLESLVVIDEH
jgi:hypothetical protein